VTDIPDPSPRLLQQPQRQPGQRPGLAADGQPSERGRRDSLSPPSRGTQPRLERGCGALGGRRLKELLSARQREGARLATMLLGHIAQLRTLAEQAGPLVPKLVEQQRLRFMERWKEAMALTEGATLPEAAQDRALTEATAFAIRIDVAEEDDPAELSPG